MEFVPGTIFANDYRVRHALSSGGMGAVYVVDQISTGKPRALKLMHAQLVHSAELRARFEQEARIGARIASEHVVEVHAAGIDMGTQQPYIVMELLEGESLAARIARSPVDPTTAREILAQMCHALIAAHAAGVVHRDLKPENVFLAVPHRIGATLTVKILDFGIAKIVEREAVATSAIGSPMWLAPEQTERSPVAPATDVWALGLLAFYMLTGQVFWRNATGPNASVPRLMREVVLDPIPLASARAAELGANLPPGFDPWFARAVVRDMNARFPDAAHAWRALEPLLQGQGASPANPAARITPGAQQFAETQPFVDASQTERERGATRPGPVASDTERPKKLGRGVLLFVGVFGASVVVSVLAVLGYRFLSHGRGDSSTPTVVVSSPPSVILDAAVPTTGATTISTTPPTGIPSGMPSFVPPAGFPGISGGGAMSGFVIAERNPDLQVDAQKQFNDHLADDLHKCVSDGKRGSVNFMTKVRPNGTVASVMAIGAAGPHVNCMTKVLEGARFASTAKGGDVVFSLFWQK